MINFYKTIDITTGEDIFINPKLIEVYTYNDRKVRIRFSSGLWREIYKSDFENMMILEGVMNIETHNTLSHHNQPH